MIEIHVLQNFAPGNPNRDDTGAPKSAHFGNKRRSRISSQCLKRSIREFWKEHGILDGHLGERTKLFPERVRELLKEPDFPTEEHPRIALAASRIAKAEDKGGKGDKETTDKRLRTPQLIFLDPGDAADFVSRLVKLKSEDAESYDFYLDPIVGFQELVSAKLEDGVMEAAHKKKVVDNAWTIAELGKSILAEKDEQYDSEATPVRVGENPDEGEAAWIVDRLINIYQADSTKKKTTFTDVIKDITEKAKQQKFKSKVTLTDAQKNKLGEFKSKLFKPLRNRAVDIALFGRMTTSDAFENVEACAEVAHAISTNEMVCEVDYFTAMDDDPRRKGPGAAHIGETQFTSNCYYKYFSLDYTALVKALAGGTAATPKSTAAATVLAATVVGEFIRAACQAIPSGKKKGSANNNPTDAILVEVKKKRIPTSYANAFVAPVTSDDGDLMAASKKKLGHYAGRVGMGFELSPQSFWYALEADPLTWKEKVHEEVKGEKREKIVEHTIAESQRSLQALIAAVLEALPKETK